MFNNKRSLDIYTSVLKNSKLLPKETNRMKSFFLRIPTFYVRHAYMLLSFFIFTKIYF